MQYYPLFNFCKRQKYPDFKITSSLLITLCVCTFIYILKWHHSPYSNMVNKTWLSCFYQPDWPDQSCYFLRLYEYYSRSLSSIITFCHPNKVLHVRRTCFQDPVSPSTEWTYPSLSTEVFFPLSYFPDFVLLGTFKIYDFNIWVYKTFNIVLWLCQLEVIST